QLELAAERAEFSHQVFQNQANAGSRPAHAFQIQRPKENAELPPIHVGLAGVAIPHRGTKQHLDEQRVGNHVAQNLAGGKLEDILIQVVVVEDLAQQPAKIIGLCRESAGDLTFQEADVVVERQPYTRKSDH